MNKLLVVVCAFGASVLSAHASYLYWQINSSDTGMSDVQSWAAASEMNWDTATFSLKDANKNTVASGTLVNLDAYEDGYQGRTGVTEINLGSITSSTGYTYYIELVNSSSPATTIGYQSGTYAQLAENATIYDDALPIDNIPQATIWHGGGGTYKAAPEPTSAMLMLLGVAGLALRRKQKDRT